MSPIRAVVLDIDGTLLDSNYHHTLAWARAFAHVDEPVPTWRVHRHIGMGGDRLVAAVAGDGVESRLGSEIRERWEHEYDRLIDETCLFAGAQELLRALRHRGLQVALASSSIPRHAEHALALLDADHLADAATTAEDAEESKPHPELIDRVLDELGTREACMIGDAVWDVVAANQRAVPTIALLTGGYGRHELEEAGAVAVYDDLVELQERLDEALALCRAAR